MLSQTHTSAYEYRPTCDRRIQPCPPSQFHFPEHCPPHRPRPRPLCLTLLQVAKYYKGDANIKLVDAGNLRMSEMAGKSEHKLGLLRRCDLLVQVVRCFDLYAPKVSASRVSHEDESSDAAEEDVLGVSMYLGAGQGEGVDESEIDWPLAPTPLEDIRNARADMAYADLQFIEERQK